MADDEAAKKPQARFVMATGLSALAGIPILILLDSRTADGITEALIMTPSMIGLACFHGCLPRLAGMVYCVILALLSAVALKAMTLSQVY